MTILAKLVRGTVYYLRDKRFEHGEEVAVTQDEKEHLEEHAVDSVTVSGAEPSENTAEFRQKFTFREVADGETEPAATGRAGARQRPKPAE